MRTGRLFPVQDDWYEWWQEPPLAGRVLVRVVPATGGRLVLAGLTIEGEPTAELLRAIPVGRIEATANAQLCLVDDALVPAPPGPQVPSRPRWGGTTPPPPPSTPDGWETTDPARATRRPSRRAADRGGESVLRGRPDLFYRDVATAYLDLAQASSRPAVDLACAHGVPQTTAHRWIKEARRRGFLPPGRPGKAG